MLTPLDHAVNRIKLQIPKEILEKTFIQPTRNRFKTYTSPISLDSLIRQKVIREIVMVDCNLLGGSEVDVAVKSTWCQIIDSNNFVVRVPKTATQNRTITEVVNATYLPQSGYMMPYGTIQAVSDATLATNKLINNLRNPMITGTAKTEIIDENVILVIGSGTIPTNLFLRCMLEYDENMSTIRRSAYKVFAQLCTLACKSYIWANRIVMMDRAEINGGYDLGRLSTIIEGYEDAADQYLEFLDEKWKKVAIMSDPSRDDKRIALITRIGVY